MPGGGPALATVGSGGIERAGDRAERPWDRGIAAAYIMLYLTILFLDQLAPWTLGVGGLGPALGGLAAAGGLAAVCFAAVPAWWGYQTKRPYLELAGSAFGRDGVRWVLGPVLYLGHAMWLAVVLYHCLDLTMRALVNFGLAPETVLEPLARSASGPAPGVYIATGLAWGLFAGVVGVLAVRLGSAVMTGYQIFPALALAGLVIWSFGGLGSFRAIGAVPRGAGLGMEQLSAPVWCFLMMIQLVLGFSAFPLLQSVDWGVTCRDKTDVRMGILVGVFASILILGTLALIAVAGSRGRMEGELAGFGGRIGGGGVSVPGGGVGPRPEAMAAEEVLAEASGLRYERWTLKWILSREVGGWPGGALGMIFAVGLLGAGCYLPWGMSRLGRVMWPGAKPLAGSLLGVLLAMPLLAVGWPARLDRVFQVSGALYAPLLGMMCGDWLVHRGRWPGMAGGVRLSAVLSWLAGVAVGCLPLIGSRSGMPEWLQTQPSALFAYLTTLVVYMIASGFAPWRPAESAFSEPVPEQKPASGELSRPGES
jgi:hypothetical protein